ncbi:hypothetical protein [Paenisporosarcina indica]|uniref:hypothetical protein n=1 Tax=Paenisporosarcina indica TaxID=650093 RepID=UPI0009500750|nr:hypothetical protein [Paenisporosarcina indica]
MTYEQALEHAKLTESVISDLGEGAWHQAWKLTSTRHEPLVLRIPKKFAYKKEVTYNENALRAEYGGTEIYYKYVNQVSPGAAPSTFYYHVSQDLTYTIESYAGNHVDLHQLSEETARELGKEIGQLYRNLERVDHGLKGVGYLAWNEKQGLHGQFSSDYRAFIKEECNEVLDDYEELSNKRPIFDKPGLKDALIRICEMRFNEISHPVLTNQDASPENWLLNNGEIRLIDPLPIVYFGEVMAGNFLNLYETLFVELAHTERYGKHRFQDCQETLKCIADGFVHGYCDHNHHVNRVVRGEQVLQVLDTAVRHLRMIESEITEEQVIRFGSKGDMEKRLTVFAMKIDELIKLL